ncbi:hypothetical protein EVAR_27412_1 [Eumeta japonica]|uniref:Uncharacterized protein n=1 Tax=Eumeta variegata TaxID=151549 RepID=A0A4C1X128_EUMVA|nr:hypothetical protein EVAR_27412_1 [Eumeta japonica]
MCLCVPLTESVASRTASYSGGAVVGSVARVTALPAFLVLRSIVRLRVLVLLALTTAGYVDKIAYRQSVSSIKETNRALARVHCWGVKNKLRFTPSTTNSMVMTKKLEYVDPVVHMNEPIVLYASCAWAPATGKFVVRKMLDVVQRSVALKACRAHHTVSLRSALILSRLLPLDIRVKEAAWLYEVKRGKDLGDTFVDREHERPL